MQTNFVKVAQKSEIPPGTSKAVKVEDNEVLLVNVNGNFYAVSQKCTHMGGDLVKGKLEGNIVTCPRHHSQFDVTNGKVVSHPKVPLMHPKAKDLQTFEVKIQNDDIMVNP